MKAKELIELLKGYEDFEVEISVFNHANAPVIDWNSYKVTGIADIGHSSKVIVLDIEKFEVY